MKSITSITGFKNQNGFSLIELLIVITILGVLSAFVTVGFTASQRKGRDANRKSDLSQYRSALESYANRRNGLYPVHTSSVAANSLCGAADLNLGITCPVDPRSGTAPYEYRYVSDAAGAKYVLYEYLEVSSNYFAMCSTGTTLTQAGVPTIGNCP